MKQTKPVIAWWSGGITSAVACKFAIDEFGDDVEIVFCDTHHEHNDTYRFLKDCEKWYGIEIISISHERFFDPVDVWRNYKALNHASGAVCSSTLKRQVREKYQDVSITKAHVFGFEAGEERRATNMFANYPEINPTFPLIERGLSKIDCLLYVQGAGIRVPKMYELGFNNNNCFGKDEDSIGGCVQGGVGYWQKIKREYPKKYAKMAELERELTEAKGKPVTIRRYKGGLGMQPIFLEPNEKYPQYGHIGLLRGIEPENLLECNGFCGTEDVQLDAFWGAEDE